MRQPRVDEQRARKIREIRERIDRDEYHVPTEQVVDALINWYRRTDPFTRR